MGSVPLSPDIISELIHSAARSVLVGRYCAASAYVMTVYDWLISIQDEWDLIWSTPQWTAIKYAYVLCRYFTLSIFPFYLWLFLNDHPEEMCKRIVHPMYGLITLFHVFPQVVMIIRTWAFTGRSPYVLYSLILCLVSFAASSIWVFGTQFVVAEQIYLLFGKSGCFAGDLAPADGSAAVRPGAVMVLAFSIDLIMLIIIVVHVYRIRSTQGRLGRHFIFQGFVVFALMSALNLAIACNYLSSTREFNGTLLPIVMNLSNVLDSIASTKSTAHRNVRAPKTISHRQRRITTGSNGGLELMAQYRNILLPTYTYLSHICALQINHLTPSNSGISVLYESDCALV
ncbi:hypothetical protein PM082_017295 [Marasmius tenuissimus]|nr:hypothetical protein PM082_017295 [Marasmius tenuissimus]